MDYYGRPISEEEELRQQLAAQSTSGRLDEPSSAAGAPDTLMIGGESLDDIIRDNSHELQRRRSVPQPFAGGGGPQEPAATARPVSMMEFGSPDDGFRGFPFGGDFGSASSVSLLPGASMLEPDMMSSMMAFSNLDSTATPEGLFGSSAGPFSGGINTDFSMGDAGPDAAAGLGLDDGEGDDDDDDDDDDNDMMGVEPTSSASTGGDSGASGKRQLGPDMIPPPPPPAPPSFVSTVQGEPSSGTAPASPTQSGDQYKNVYSRSGFDMLRALWYVTRRKNPEVHLGAVDMSCSFVVCDALGNDCPIVYASDNFQNLTGYNRHNIIGQNCRFLQAPDGHVEAGAKREFVENRVVHNLRTKLAEGREAQQSLINYRRGGKPFLNLITIIPIPWDTDEIRYFVGFQIDLVECPDAISGQATGGGVQVNYKHSDIGQYIFQPPTPSRWDAGERGQTLGVDDVSALLDQHEHRGSGVVASDWHRQSWDKMLLENVDDVVHVLSLKGLFLYLSPSCRRVLEYDAADLVGSSLSSICHPSDIVPVTRELKDTAVGRPVNIVFRICRKLSGYTWFESRGSLFVEQGRGRKCIILTGRKHPVFALRRRDLEASGGGIGDSEIWTKLSTSGAFLFVSSSVRSLLDLQPETLRGTSIQELMRKESRVEFGRAMERARRGRAVACKHEVQNKRGQVLQAHTTLYPGDAVEGTKATFLLAQTKLLKASSRSIAPAGSHTSKQPAAGPSAAVIPSTKSPAGPLATTAESSSTGPGPGAPIAGGIVSPGSQEAALADDDNIFDELKTTRCTSWQFELRQMEKVNRLLAEELAQLLSSRKKRKRRKGAGNVARDCANCHTRNTPEWRRGPSGNRDLCNSCGLRWAKQIGRVSPRNSSRGGGTADGQSEKSGSPLHREVPRDAGHPNPSHTPRSDSSQSSIAVTPGHATATVTDNNPAAGSSTTTVAAFSNPPQSQPLLAGGSGAGGSSMRMAPIREEQNDE